MPVDAARRSWLKTLVTAVQSALVRGEDGDAGAMPPRGGSRASTRGPRAPATTNQPGAAIGTPARQQKRPLEESNAAAAVTPSAQQGDVNDVSGTPQPTRAPAPSLITSSTRKRPRRASAAGATDDDKLQSPAPARRSAAAEEDPEPRPRALATAFESDEEQAAPAEATTSSKGVLDTIFSPVFQILGGQGEDQGVAGTSGAADPGVEVLAQRSVTPVEEEEGGGAGAECNEDFSQADAEDDDEEYDEDFDPYLFIHNLPPLELAVPGERSTVLPCKTRRAPPNTLVLDLDETLVHSTLEESENEGDFDFHFPVVFNNQEHTVNVRCRPHLQQFMEAVSQRFEVVVFTASQQLYAERVLNIIDPGRKYFRHRIYRDSCVMVDGNYLKDLSCLGRDLSRTAIIDNSPQAFGFQLANGIPIESWFDDGGDRELLEMLPFLDKLARAQDVRPLIARQFGLHDRVKRAGHRAAQYLRN